MMINNCIYIYIYRCGDYINTNRVFSIKRRRKNLEERKKKKKKCGAGEIFNYNRILSKNKKNTKVNNIYLYYTTLQVEIRN